MPPETAPRTIQLSKKKVIWWSIGLIILALILWGLFNMFLNSRSMNVGGSIASFDGGGGYNGIASEMSTRRGGGNNNMPSVDMWPPNEGSNSINDTREFLKMSYSANIKTRHVEEDIETAAEAVRNAEGRVDSMQSGEKNGYLRFVVPKSEFDKFQEEIEAIAHAKLFTENISSQNLLSEKQGIESTMINATQSLAELQETKKTTDAQHAAQVKYYEQAIATLNNQIGGYSTAIAQSDSSSERTTLQTQHTSLVQQRNVLQQQLQQEHTSYTTTNQTLVARINGAQGQVDQTIQTDIAFGEKIETVNGTINANWVSVWTILREVLPIRPGWIVLILLIIALITLRKTHVLPKVQLV